MKGDAVVQSRDIVMRMSEILRKRGFAPADVRDLLVYVTDEDAATSALVGLRDAFSSRVPASAVRVRLAAAGARVEIMAYAERE
jgi:enamine deaminase RidA (YjgF/YER057c/UK114 family)